MNKQNATGRRAFLQNKFSDKPFFAVRGTLLLDFEFFFFFYQQFKKYNQISGSLHFTYAPINVKPAGRGRAWGGDLIVFVVPGVGHLTDIVLPAGEGIFESFFARRGDI